MLYGWARSSTVIQSAGFPGGAAQELPGAFRVRGERPLEQREREPARLEVRRSRNSRSARNSSGDGRSRRVRLTEPADDGAQQRPADTEARAEARGDELLAGEVLRVGQIAQARAEGGGERIGVLEMVGQRGAQGFSGRPMSPRRRRPHAPWPRWWPAEGRRWPSRRLVHGDGRTHLGRERVAPAELGLRASSAAT